MSKGQCKPRNQPLKKALGRCKARDTIEIIDVEDKDADDKVDDDDVEIIEAETSHRRMKRNSPPSEVINIDDDDEDAPAAYQYGNINSPSSEESKSGTSPVTTRPLSEPQKNNSDIGPSRNHLGLGSSSSESCSLGSDSSSESVSSDSSSSDCEIMGDVSGNIREQWERAALKRKMSHKAQIYPEDDNFENEVFAEPNNLYSVPSTTYFSSSWNFDAKAANNDIDLTSDFFYDKPTMETGPTEMNTKYVPDNTYSGIFHDFIDAEVSTKDSDSGTVHKDREPDIVCNDPDTEAILNPFPEINVSNATTSCGNNNVTSQKTADVEDAEKIHLGKQDMSNHQFSSTLFNGKTNFEASTSPSLEEEMKNDHNAPGSRMQVQDGLIINREKYKETDEYGQAAEEMNIDHTALGSRMHVQDGLIINREKYKETDEYRQAAEEEWAARQRELQIQAEEAQRMKRKKKAETLRLVDMERRQRQRIEEVRELQKKDEETINLKEKIRAGVRRELEILEARHRDMASVLRALGVPVKGGLLPTSPEVNAAYKQALLKFHPDRASRSDIHQQVKSEETFKLISRLKEKFML